MKFLLIIFILIFNLSYAESEKSSGISFKRFSSFVSDSYNKPKAERVLKEIFDLFPVRYNKEAYGIGPLTKLFIKEPKYIERLESVLEDPDLMEELADLALTFQTQNAALGKHLKNNIVLQVKASQNYYQKRNSVEGRIGSVFEEIWAIGRLSEKHFVFFGFSKTFNKENAELPVLEKSIDESLTRLEKKLLPQLPAVSDLQYLE